MKKILGISLCALFAVSAANANIASTEWVLEEIGDPVRSVGTGTANGTISVDGTDVAVKGLGSAAYKSIDDFATGEEGDLAASALQQTDVTIGGANGTISVKGADVAVKGLGSAAYTSTDDYADAAQGAKADSAVQVGDVTTGTNNGTISVQGTEVAVKGLGSAAYADAETFATGEEGDLAASALQQTDVTIGGANGTISVKGADVAVKGLGSAAYTESNAYAPSTLTGTVDTNTANISSLTNRVAANEGGIRTINTTIAGMSENETGSHFIQGVTQSNGTVVATGKDFEEILGATTTDNAPTSKAVADYVKSKMDGLGALAELNEVTSNEITNDTIMNADISPEAAIETRKIAFSDAEKAALGSTITAAKVGQIETNKTNITSLQTTVSQHNEALKPSSECLNNADGCTLVYRNNAYSWEKITREAQ